MAIILVATIIVDHWCMTASMLVIHVTVITAVDIQVLYWFRNVLIMSNDIELVADQPSGSYCSSRSTTVMSLYTTESCEKKQVDPCY